MTVLYQVASTELLNFLVNAGADVNMQAVKGLTALHFAAGWGHTEPYCGLYDSHHASGIPVPPSLFAGHTNP